MSDHIVIRRELAERLAALAGDEAHDDIVEELGVLLDGGDAPHLYQTLPWKLGKFDARLVYVDGDVPPELDKRVGSFATHELAQEAVDLHNMSLLETRLPDDAQLAELAPTPEAVDALEGLVRGVRSLGTSLPFCAPEAIASMVYEKVGQRFNEYEALVNPK